MICLVNKEKYSLVEVPISGKGFEKTQGGIILPDVDLIRSMRREKAKEGLDIMDINDRPRDNYLWGKYLQGSLEVSVGSHVLFNKFDADEIKHEKKRYYRILNENALAYYKD